MFAATWLAAIGASIVLAAQSQSAVGLTACQALQSLALPNMTVTLAGSVPARSFVPPGSRVASEAGAFELLPSFCRVAATLTPSADSDIRIEVWLPEEGWNGKFQAVGNGGWAGAIQYAGLAEALQRGYATASTDTGHTGGSGVFAFGHPEKLVDFAYRAVHEMTVQAKSIIEAFYDDRPSFSYWVGCSAGGRQGLKEAQQFPQDYDGIVAGAPALDVTHLALATQLLWVGGATQVDSGSYVPPERFGLIHRAALSSCDTRDGVEDGAIEDPRRCAFDPAVLVCAEPDPRAPVDSGGDPDHPDDAVDGDRPECLTSAQVESVRRMYAAATHPQTGEEIFPGLEPGSEQGWSELAARLTMADEYYKHVVFEDPDWDFNARDVDETIALAEAADRGVLNADDPDVGAFVDRGGKLLMWHGWSDGTIPPRSTIDYLERVQSTLANDTRESVRLFMAPGVGHCGGGAGPASFDMLTALERWVEEGAAAERIVASRVEGGEVVRTRPLCPYPQVARYTSSGSTDDEANFVCR